MGLHQAVLNINAPLGPDPSINLNKFMLSFKYTLFFTLGPEFTMNINKCLMCIRCFPLSFTGQICFPTKLELLLYSLQHNYSQYFCILSLSLCVSSFDIFHNIFSLSLALWETEANHLSELRPHKQKAESIAVKHISEQRLFNINILGSRHKKP